jgi:ABC-type transporter Mla subunit MlaD
MASREREQRTNLIVGLFIILFVALGAVSFVIIGQRDGQWESKTTIRADFRTISGLRKGSPVQLSGVQIGTVESIDFVTATYACDPATEDFGRFGDARTDNCDPTTFCARDGQCAELEPWASKELHPECTTDADCTSDEVCITRDFRRRYRRVTWTGLDGVCARTIEEHRRVQITMQVFADKLELIRTDSRATIAQNGVLGDQLVAITPGSRDPLSDDPELRRIQSLPSLFEDLGVFRDRLDSLTDKIDSSLAGITNLFQELNDPKVIDGVKGTITNVETITGQMARGEGVVGALLNDPDYRSDFGRTLRSLRSTADGVDRFVTRANSTLKKVDANVQPLVEDARAATRSIKTLLEELKDPANKSLVAKAIYDPEGKLVADLESAVADLESVMGKIDDGQGTVGKLINSPQAHDDLVRLLGNLNRNKTLKTLVRWALEADEKNAANNPDPPATASDPRPNPETARTVDRD